MLYSYDADGGRVRKETATEITRYIGPHYEVTIAIASGQVLATTKYYEFGGQRTAVRQNGTLSYLLGDHLGSTAVTTDSAGNRLATNTELRYYPYGSTRYNTSNQVTTYRFTGQRWDAGTAIYFYNARWYDPYRNQHTKTAAPAGCSSRGGLGH